MPLSETIGRLIHHALMHLFNRIGNPKTKQIAIVTAENKMANNG